MRTVETTPISNAELPSLFHDLENVSTLVLAVSGGPDSTALMVLADRWRRILKRRPKLIAVTIDHGLRKESKREADAVAKLARKLKIAHRTLRWTAKKPKTGIQRAAREARYRLLGQAARQVGASVVLTGHTRDDQAETMLIRMCRGSGMSGLAAMGRASVFPTEQPLALQLIRPFLEISKARLIATLEAANIPFAEDPSNRDPRFTRARVRPLMAGLAAEGLTSERLALLARRLRRADAALETAVDRATTEVRVLPARGGPVVFDAAGFNRLPAEIALRLLGRAINQTGDEGPVELAKLETLTGELSVAYQSGKGRFRRTLAGASVTLSQSSILVEIAPPRQHKALRESA